VIQTLPPARSDPHASNLPDELVPVDPIPISDHESRCRLPRERLDHLPPRPPGSRVRGHKDGVFRRGNDHSKLAML